MISYENWIVAPYDENIYSILHFLLPEFSRIFSPDIMRAETCTVFNDPSSKCPMLIISRNPIQIQLSQESTQYWAQTIYQLSHEMCHYAIRQGHKGDSYILSWLEETICEAMSLYALEWASNNWYRCPLSMGHSEYSSSIFTYLKDTAGKPERNDLQSCVTLLDLRICNQTAESNRGGRVRERNILYVCISRHPEESRFLCDMYRYLNEDKLTIDFDTWLADNPSEIVKCLSEIQPKIVAD